MNTEGIVGRATRSFIGPVMALAVLLCSAERSMKAQSAEGAIVARRSARIAGDVQGDVVLVEQESHVVVERGGRVAGNLVLPREKTQKAALVREGPANVGREKKASRGPSVETGGASVVSGKQIVHPVFSIPPPERARTSRGNVSSVIEKDRDAAPDYRKLKNLTLRNEKREIILPPGVYGNIVVERGRLVLGESRRKNPRDFVGSAGDAPRYYFESLTVGSRGSVDVQERTVVIVGTLGAIEGKLGNERFTNRLDLRVASGAVTVGPNSEIFGAVLAQRSAVALKSRARLRGGLVCDEVVVEPDATFTGVKPSWSAESSGNSLPLFFHKAIRAQARFDEVADHHAKNYMCRLEYDEDVPVFILERSKDLGSREEQREAHEAFFHAWCTLLDGTGFTKGRVVLFSPGGMAGTPPSGLRIDMEVEQFEHHLSVIGREGHPRDNIRKIREDSVLLNLFMARSIRMAGAAAVQH